MKRMIILLGWLLTSVMVNAQVDFIYPSYDSVVTKFFSQYSIKDIASSAQVNFEKRPTGWHIRVTDDLSNSETIKDELFWSRKENKFTEIDFGSLLEYGENDEFIASYRSSNSTGFYDSFPYYGYPNWDGDVIRDFADETNLPDSTLYALGRAYSSFATNLLYSDKGWTDGRHLFDLPNKRNCLTQEQLNTYRHYRHLAIDKFIGVKKLNPAFETIVGSIDVKAANEYLNSFLDLRIFQNEEEAMKELPDGLYSDFMISVAKNYLRSCAENAILFTGGDNDTFPLLYVQAKYGFRTDVLVVNLSMLLTERYVNSLREQILDSPGLPISLTPSEISNDKRAVVIVEGQADSPMDLNDIMEFVKNDKNTKTYGGRNYFYIPSNHLRFRHSEKQIEWMIDRYYILMNQLVFLDVLCTDNMKRPIYFCNAMDHYDYFGIQDYLQLEGITYRFTSDKKATQDDQRGSVNSSKLYDNLMRNFEWIGLDSIVSHEKYFCFNYGYSFIRLAEKLIEEQKLDSAKSVLKKCLEIFPSEVLYYRTRIAIVRIYYKMNEYEQGNKIAKDLITNFKEEEGNTDAVANGNLVITELKALASEFHQLEILDLLNQ